MKQKEDKVEVMRGSGNVYKDFNYPDAEVRHLKAKVAAEIIGTLDQRQWSVRRAAKETGFQAADFSRVRNAELKRFTLDRLVRMLGSLKPKVRLDLVPITRRSRRRTHLAAHVSV
ncbi:helix-turn-helix domain-containing protein [Candidatus Nitrospira salsa]